MKMKSATIAALALTNVASSYQLKFIDNSDQFNSNNLAEKPQSMETSVLDSTNPTIKRQDPDMLNKMSKYNWEDVPPHSQAFYICNNKLKVTRQVAEPGFPPSGDRKLPDRYQGQSGDDFMGTIISKYAMEGGKAAGKPNGDVWFEWDGAEKASLQVL